LGKLSAWALDPLERTRDQIALAVREVDRFARVRLTRVGNDRAVREKPDSPLDRVAKREMAVQKLARAPIPNGDADVVSEMILGVARDEDAVAPSLGAAVGCVRRFGLGPMRLLFHALTMRQHEGRGQVSRDPVAEPRATGVDTEASDDYIRKLEKQLMEKWSQWLGQTF
jgi:hypothetical protein